MIASTGRDIMNIRLASLPDPLVSLNKQKVNTLEQWIQLRRPEILELFRENVYGNQPLQRPESLSFHTIAEEDTMKGLAVRKEIHITFEGPGGIGKIRVLLFIPKEKPKPAPLFLLAAIKGQEIFESEISVFSEFWPVEYILTRGYATAVFQVEDLDPDYDDGFQNGVHGVFDQVDTRPANAWATISAWAWGASRVMDYVETDQDVDSSRVALAGHSRGGKAVLWAGASDPRFAMVVSNNSGCSGAAISRGKIGEKLRNINDGNPHWFNEKYKSFNDRENELPIDQHMLLSLIAPRLLYVSSASEDIWADPESEFLSLVLTEPVYQLFGLSGLGTQEFPRSEVPIHSENIGYHVRTGKHDITKYDWKCFIDFANKNF
jgi:hypothetical protein